METTLPPTIANGLASNTKDVFEVISAFACLKHLYLCGGTAQSIIMNHRLSEGLDFESLTLSKNKGYFDAHLIISEVRSAFPKSKLEVLGENRFQMFVGSRDDVKLSFFRPEHSVKTMGVGLMFNNIKTPTKQELLGMKVFTTSVRFAFRDYYDIYCLLKDGQSLKEAMSYASHLSYHRFRSKQMLLNLTSPYLFVEDKRFQLMNPKYEVSSEQIASYIIGVIETEEIKTKQKP